MQQGVYGSHELITVAPIHRGPGPQRLEHTSIGVQPRCKRAIKMMFKEVPGGSKACPQLLLDSGVLTEVLYPRPLPYGHGRSGPMLGMEALAK